MTEESAALHRIEQKIDQLTAMIYAKDLVEMLREMFPPCEVTYIPPDIQGEPCQIQLIPRRGSRFVTVLVRGSELIWVNWLDEDKRQVSMQVRGPSGVPRDQYSLRNELYKVLDRQIGSWGVL
ncbi:MAG: hypothetical protein V1895_04195 [Parcubacteria group bacterium]